MKIRDRKLLQSQDLIAYEMAASAWWASWIFWKWGHDLVASYIVFKVKRKYCRYLYWLREVSVLERKSQ